MALRLGGQLRIATVGNAAIYVGWDMSAALNLGAALHIDPALIAEMLPDIERAAMSKLNETRGSDG